VPKSVVRTIVYALHLVVWLFNAHLTTIVNRHSFILCRPLCLLSTHWCFLFNLLPHSGWKESDFIF